MQRRRRRAIPILLALVAAAALALVPLTAGGQEDGRPPGAEPGPAATEAATAPGAAFDGWDGDGPRPQTLVHSGDSTIQGGLCVGFDCASNEPMGFATIKIEENNLRIAAADSSTVSGFPTTDWQIEFNSSSSGGGSYFMVRDCGSGGAAGSVDSTCGGTPMLTIEGGADNESIHVDSSGNQGGNVGFGTATPVVDLHVLSGNTPTLRLEQDNSSGFTPQSWDVAGNEANFFIRDVTNGSALPIRIEPGTASNTLYLDNNERIGINTTSPQQQLHIRSAGAPGFRLEDSANSHSWDVSVSAAGALFYDKVADPGTEMRLQPDGTLRITGSLIAEGGDGTVDPGDTFPDYVFASGYQLRSLSDVAAFIEANGHLPGVMSAADVSAEGGINMTMLQLQLLEKVEELTLYTLAQQQTIDGLRADNAGLRARVADLAALVESIATD